MLKSNKVNIPWPQREDIIVLRINRTPRAIIVRAVAAKTPERNQNKILRLGILYLLGL
jgi:hypothetical protein